MMSMTVNTDSLTSHENIAQIFSQISSKLKCVEIWKNFNNFNLRYIFKILIYRPSYKKFDINISGVYINLKTMPINIIYIMNHLNNIANKSVTFIDENNLLIKQNFAGIDILGSLLNPMQNQQLSNFGINIDISKCLYVVFDADVEKMTTLTNFMNKNIDVIKTDTILNSCIENKSSYLYYFIESQNNLYTMTYLVLFSIVVIFMLILIILPK